MKKVILGITLLSQFTYGVEGDSEFAELAKREQQSLVPLSFFQASESRFKEELGKSIQRMNNGTNLETEVVALENFCHNEFEYAKKEANRIFSKCVKEQLADQKEKMREIIASKDEEIINLQAKLDSLLSESPSISEGIKILDEQRRDAEERVRKTWNSSQTEECSDVIKKNEKAVKDRIDIILSDIFEELNKIKEEVRQNSMNVVQNLENILGQTQYMYGVNVKSLVRDLKFQYSNDLKNISLHYNYKEERIKEAYESQKNLLNNMIDKVTILNLNLKKEKELKKKIGMILSQNRIDPRDIIKNTSTQVLSMDLPDRYRLLSTLYNEKFLPFSSLLESNDLSAINNYINAINIIPRAEIGDFEGYYFGWGCESYTQWNYRNIYEIRRAKSYGANIPGHENRQKPIPWLYPITFWANAAHAGLIESERQRINREIRKEQDNYNRAKELVFPSEEFKRTIEKINGFFKEFL